MLADGTWCEGAATTGSTNVPFPAIGSPRRRYRLAVDTRDHFAKLAPSYARLRGGDVFVSPLTEALVREARLERRRVLDVGCGTGRLLRELVDRYRVDAVGVDRSAEMIYEAHEVLGEAAELHVGAAEALPLPDESVERGVMTMVAHHLDRPLALGEMRRVLIPSGVLAIADTDPEALDGFWMASLFPSYVEIDRQRFPTAEQLRVDLGGAAYEDVRVLPFEMERTFARETGLAKLRGRAYSTFAYMSDDEYREGLERAERELPAVIRYTLRLLIALGSRGG